MIRISTAVFVLVLAGCSSGATSGAGGGAAGGGNGTGGTGGSGGGGGSAGGGAGGAAGGNAGGGVGGGSAGGGTGGSGGGFATDGGQASYACDIQPVVNARCLDCHSAQPKFGAPMSLVTFADTQANSASHPGSKIFQRMAIRVADDAAPMPQAPNARLTPAQIARFQQWAAQGGTMGSCAAPDAGMDAGSPVDAGNPDECPAGTIEYKFTAPAFTIPSQTDFYQCFATTVQGLPAGKNHMVKLTKVIDDDRVLHHMVLFKDVGKNAPASKGNCGIEGDWSVQYAWAPGAGPLDMPADVGMPLSNGDQLVIQIHYNNSTSVMGMDSSGAKMCLLANGAQRAKEGGVLAIGPTKWSPDLPPNCVKAEAEGSCNYPSFAGSTVFNVFTVWPHMHKKGKAMTTTLKSGATSTVVTNRANYSFNSQYLEPANFQFKPGDTLYNKCRWDTSGATSGTPWGEDTDQEMCFNFLYVWPPPVIGGQPVPFCPSLPQTATSSCVP